MQAFFCEFFKNPKLSHIERLILKYFSKISDSDGNFLFNHIQLIHHANNASKNKIEAALIFLKQKGLFNFRVYSRQGFLGHPWYFGSLRQIKAINDYFNGIINKKLYE